MINLAGRDILHSWGRFIFTGMGLGLLIGVTLTMAGVYRGMVDDAKVLLDTAGADLWVVQKDTLGPFAEPSGVHDAAWRSIRGVPGVALAANVAYMTMQIGARGRDVRAMVVGVVPGIQPEPGQPGRLVAGRRFTRGHYEAIADVATGFRIGENIRIRKNAYTVVGLTSRMVSSGGDPMVFIPLRDAQGPSSSRTATRFSSSGDGRPPIRSSTGRAPRMSSTRSSPRRHRVRRSTRFSFASSRGRPRKGLRSRSGAGSGFRCTRRRRWRTFSWGSSSPRRRGRSGCSS